MIGLEPTTVDVSDRCSTNWATHLYYLSFQIVIGYFSYYFRRFSVPILRAYTVGFGPTRDFRLIVLETIAIDHSATYINFRLLLFFKFTSLSFLFAVSNLYKFQITIRKIGLEPTSLKLLTMSVLPIKLQSQFWRLQLFICCKLSLISIFSKN